MKILVVGSGGREHALAWALCSSSSVDSVTSAPGNPGLASLGACIDVRADDIDGICSLVEREQFNLVVVGPEQPLVQGLADRLRQLGIACFGPGAGAAKLEGSKVFAKECMQRAAVPTARFRVAEGPEETISAVREFGFPVVLKVDGLASGKGVHIATTPTEAGEFADQVFRARRFGDAGRRMIVEEFLQGYEASVFFVTNGDEAVALPPVRDYKRLLAGGLGPNTGGMGAVAPVEMDEVTLSQVRERIALPILAELQNRGAPFVGLLYCGLMLTADGPRVLEFNCRFGDPETQVLMPLLDGDLASLLEAAARGDSLSPVAWQRANSVGVVVAAPGYPEAPRTGGEILGVGMAATIEQVQIFHAGTRRVAEKLQCVAGRVLTVVGCDVDLDRARELVYHALELVRLDGAQWRDDIGLGAALIDKRSQWTW